jgi:uncharacterized damage-inducible protein DinB
MTERQRIAELYRSVYEGDASGEAWHGAALKPLLKDVTAHEASRNPGVGRHTVLQLVLHLAYWEEIFLRRLNGETVDAPLNSPEDWPANRKVADAEWHAALARLDKAHTALSEAVAQCSDAKLQEKAPGKDYDNYTVIHGILHHAVYHTAQIVLIKKACRHDT